MFSGLAVDVGMVQLRKLQLQHAADAAALGALYERARGYSDWVAAGKADAAMNGFTDGANGVTISIVSPPTSGAYSGNAKAIQTTAVQSYHTAFMGLVGSGYAAPGAMSVAMSTPNPNCVFIMGVGTGNSGWGGWSGGGHGTGGGGQGGSQCGNGWNGWNGGGGYYYYPLALQSSASLTSSCSVYVDSTSYSVESDWSSTLSVAGGKSIQVQGASSTTSLQGATSPAPTYNSANENDPLSNETAPTFSSCTYNNKSLSHTTATLSPGTYCGGITINGSTVTFNTGLYIVTGGMNWTNNSRISGSGTTFYLTSGGGSNYGTVNILNSTVTLSAPASTSNGGIAGIVVFGDRNWSDPGNQDIEISSSTVTTDGIWYVINTGIECDSSILTAVNYLGIVTDNLQVNGGSVTVPSPNYSSLSGGSPYQGSSVGGIVQ